MWKREKVGATGESESSMRARRGDPNPLFRYCINTRTHNHPVVFVFGIIINFISYPLSRVVTQQSRIKDNGKETMGVATIIQIINNLLSQA